MRLHQPIRGIAVTSPNSMLVRLLISAYPEFKRRLAGRLGSVELANEALQDTYIRLSRAEIPGEIRNPRSYIFVTALNIARNNTRAEARHLLPAEVDTLVEIPDDAPDALRTLEARSELAAVEKALQSLSTRRRAMFRRFWIESAEYKDLAAEFNVSERTVRHELMLANRYVHEATSNFCAAELQDRLRQVSSL